MMIECRLLRKISMGPIIFILLLPFCSRLLIVILSLSVTSLFQTLLSLCYMLIAEICLVIHVIRFENIPLSCQHMTFLSLLSKILLSLPPLTVFVSLRLVSCCFELLGKTHQWTEGTLSTASCRFKTNYTYTKGPKKHTDVLLTAFHCLDLGRFILIFIKG